MDHYSWAHNISIWTALLAWLVAQLVKMVRGYLRTGKLDLGGIFQLGGMPSSHSAMVSALTVSVGLECGFGTPLFAAVLVFAAVVMFDAQSVRRAAGQQARLLNQLVEELFKEKHFSQQKLVELLGHTPLEVILGMALGILVALAIHGGASYLVQAV